jgi:hypothetical protein
MFLADPPVNSSGDQEARRDSVHPDPLGHDDDILTQSETLDEDDMGVDPLEGGMDPAEDWSASNRYGTTATEQATDRRVPPGGISEFRRFEQTAPVGVGCAMVGNRRRSTQGGSDGRYG